VSMPRVAVVGGSIAGLTAANLLRDAGCEVDVYERSNVLLSGFGTGIVVQPELVRYMLERTTVTLEELSVPSTSMRYFNAEAGLQIGEVAADWRFTAYNAVYRQLLDAFGLDRYHLGWMLTSIGESDSRPIAHFEGRPPVEADLIVCADGVGSVARSTLLGVTPQYAGYVTWRGMVDEEALSAETWRFFQDAFTYGLLHDSHIIAYPIPRVSPEGALLGTPRLNFQWYWNVAEGPDLDQLMTDASGVRRPVSVHHDMLASATLESLHARASTQLSEPFRELITAARQPFVTVLADAEINQMAFRGIALIGDAAITPRPHAAAGAAKAALDGWNLVEKLVHAEGHVQEALAAWEPVQLEIGHAYLKKVRAMAQVLQHGGDFPPGAPEYRFGLPT